MGTPNTTADFTARVTMVTLPEIVALLTACARIAVVVESLVKEHGMSIPAEFASAFTAARQLATGSADDAA